MILEDDSIILEIFTRVMRPELNVFPCRTLDEYEAALNKTKFDIFIIDLALGSKKDGIQIIRELRQMESYKSTPIVVVTAHAFHSDENEAMNAGATKFLRKPVENIVLLNTITSLLNDKTD
jgi:putative two-component system response regulator